MDLAALIITTSYPNISLLTQQANPELPLPFRSIIIVFLFLLISVTIFLLYRNRRFTRNLNSSMMEAQEQIQDLDRCQIENLNTVSEALSSSGNDQVAEAGVRLHEDAERLYQGKWIPSPEPYLDQEALLTPRQNTQISYEPPLQILALSVVASAVAMLFALNLTAGSRTSGLQFGLFPALLGLVAATLLSVQIYRSKRSLKQNATSLSRSIRRRVPVFEELSGTAALIESFVRYDRDMSASVETLTQTVDDLSKNKLVELISRNLSATLREELSPPLRDTQQSIGLLARELTEYQATGVGQMVHAFIDELSQGMTVHLSQIMDRMDKMTDRLEDHYQELGEAQRMMHESREQSATLQSELNETLLQLRNSRSDWQDDLSEARVIQHELSATLAAMHKLQAGETDGLNRQLQKLSQQLQRYQESAGRTEKNLEKLNQLTGESVESFSASSTESLNQIRELVQKMGDQTSAMSKTQELSTAQLETLNRNLNSSVREFNQQVHSGVDATLNQFDEGLAEISHRLAGATSDLQETVDRLTVEQRKTRATDGNQSK